MYRSLRLLCIHVMQAGIQAGDTVIYTSSFFGDELWPADKLGFARSAIQVGLSSRRQPRGGVCGGLVLTDLLQQRVNPAHVAAAHQRAIQGPCEVHARSLAPASQAPASVPPAQAAPSPVSLVLVRGPNDSVDVKKLPKKPAPARFGRRLTAAQKARATHLCVDCGYVSLAAAPFLLRLLGRDLALVLG